VNKGKVLGGALIAITVVAGFYLANRYWIAPIVLRQAQAKVMAQGGDHPMAPDFTLTELNGQKLSLSDYRGKVVLLDFWATWCGPCRVEIPGLIELQNKYRDQGFTVIGVSLDDSIEPVKDFYQEFRMNYPVAVASDKKVELLYGGIIGLPTAFLVGRDGRIYSKHPGAQPTSVFEEEIKALLAVKGAGEAEDFHPAGHASPEDKIEVSTPEEVNSEIPGIDISKLTAEQKAEFKKVLAQQKCTCQGCKYNLLDCRRLDSTCPVSRKLAKEQLAILLGKPGAQTAQKAGGAQVSAAPVSAKVTSQR
jgi:peroxiredoxin